MNNFILCQFVKTDKVKSAKGEEYCILTILYDDKAIRLFYRDFELYEKIKLINKLQDIKLYVEIVFKFDGTITLKPLAYEV